MVADICGNRFGLLSAGSRRHGAAELRGQSAGHGERRDRRIVRRSSFSGRRKRQTTHDEKQNRGARRQLKRLSVEAQHTAGRGGEGTSTASHKGFTGFAAPSDGRSTRKCKARLESGRSGT